MGQQDLPVLAYEIKRTSTLLYPQSTCIDGEGKAMPAFRVERYEQLQINAGKSVNVLGGTTDLAIAFHPQNDEIYERPSLTYNFPVVGCQYIDVVVDDTNVGKHAEHRVWFDVKNALPTLQNLILSFPQS